MLHTKTPAADDRILLQTEPADLRNLILKLRWMGSETEAIRLHARLADIAPGDCAVLWPIDTD